MGNRKEREDQTAELSLGDLVPVEERRDPTMDLELDDEVEIPAPPKPGLGRPRRARSAHDQTIGAMPSPSRPPPPPTARPSKPPRPKKKTKASLPPPPPNPTGTRAPAPTTQPPTTQPATASPTPAGQPPTSKRSVPPPATPPTPKAAASVAPPPPPKKKKQKKKQPRPTPTGARASAPPAPAAAAPSMSHATPARSEPPEPIEAPIEAPREAPAADTSAAELRDLCLAQLDEDPPTERKARLHFELARLYELELHEAERPQYDKAAEHYQAAQRLAPDHGAALRGARRTLAAIGRHAALPALFDAEAAITRDPIRRAQLLHEKARVMETQLRQSLPALSVYREALTLDPGNVTYLLAIERAHRRDQRWPELAETLGKLAQSVDDAALRASWLSQRAHITETRLENPEAAAALYEAAFEADPRATGALAHIKRLAPPLERWNALVDALTIEVRLTADRAAQDSTRLLLAELQAVALEDPAAAVETLRACLGGAADRRALQRIAELHRDRGRARDEAETLAQLIELVHDAGERADLALRLGQLQEQPLEDPDRALPWYRRCLEDDPTSRDAAHALLRIHETRGHWDDVIAVLETQLAGRRSAAAKADLHHRVATLYEQRRGNIDAAIDAHIAALAADPDHAEAFRDLARVYATESRWSELAELYGRAVDRARHDEEAIAWMFRWAAVLEDRLDDPGGALAVYKRILERDSAHLGALHAAQRAAERHDDATELVGLLEAEAKLEPRPEATATLLLRAARITSVALDDASGAIQRIERILQRTPRHRPSLEALAELLDHAGRWQDVVKVYQRLLPLTSTEAEKVRLHHRIGQIFETLLAKPEPAVQAYRHALALDRSFRPAREALARALEDAGQHGELAALLESRLASLRGTERADVATRLGLLRERQLDDLDGAIEAFETALAAAPQHRPALDARARIWAQQAQWTRLADALHEEAESARDPFLRTQAALLEADVRAHRQGSPGPAIDAYAPVLSQTPRHLGALLALEALQARLPNAEGRTETLEQLANAVTDPRAELASLQDLAQAQTDAGVDATATHRRVLTLRPDDPAALAAIAESATEHDRPAALSMHARLATGSADPTVGAFHQCRVGELLLAEDDALGALAAFRAALALDPRSLAATRGLSRAARVTGDPAALRQAARHEAEVTQDPKLAVQLLIRAAILRAEAGETEEAAQDYEKALTLSPEHTDAAHGLAATRLELGQVGRLTEQLTRAAHEAHSPGRKSELHTLVARLHADSSGDLGAAIAAVERALDAAPNDPNALSRLARYLGRAERWDEAAGALDKLLPRTKDADFVDAHLRLAHICVAHLEDRDRAMRSYRAALSRDDQNRVALSGLTRLERLAGRDQEALRLVRRLLGVVDTPAHRSEALAQLAEIEAGRNHPDLAAEAALASIGIAGATGAGAAVYRELVALGTEHASWDGYVDALTDYLTQPDAEAPPAYRELARIFSESLKRPDRAIATLREGTQACPADASISLALADALRSLSAEDKATTEIRRLLSVDVTLAEGWRALGPLVEGEVDGRAVALAPLVSLGVATAAERATVEARQPRPADAPAAILVEPGLKQLCEHGALDESATALVRILTDVFAKLEGFDADEWGLTRRDRVRQGDPHPVRQLADRIAPIFGVSDFDLYVTDAHGLDRAVIVPGSPPALLVGAAIESASDVELTYHLARPLALYARYLHSIDILPDEDIHRVLAAAARHFEHDVPIAELDAEELEEETRRVGKAIGFFSRARIQEGVTAFAERPPTDARWLADLRRMAHRAALLVCDDLVGALRANGTALGDDPVADDLARFWASDPAMRYRRAIAQNR